MRGLVAILLALLLASGCVAATSYSTALEEFHNYGKDGIEHCWAKGDPFKCGESVADEKLCIQSALANQQARPLSHAQAMGRIEPCMYRKGWIRLAVSEMVY